MVEEMRSIQADLPYDEMLAVPYLGRRGGLAMLWKEEVKLHPNLYLEPYWCSDPYRCNEAVENYKFLR